MRYGERGLTSRLEKIRELERKQSGRTVPSQLIASALIEAGYISLDTQAKALGLNRSTVWNIMKSKHKLGRLNSKTARCIWANPDTPASVRAIIDAVFQTNLLQSSERNND
jgi:hypothetical protein